MSLMINNQAVAVILAFVAWTVTSFLCHECGKLFLSGYQNLQKSSEEDTGSASHFLASGILTTVQCLTCILSVSMTFGFQSTLSVVMVISHVMATWVTNYSLSYIEAASTMAIKLTEPVIMAIAHHVVFKTPVSIGTYMSFPLIILGALMFSIRTTLVSADTVGISLAFLSNVVLAASNVAIKKLQVSSSHVQLRPVSQICELLGVQAIVLLLIYYLESDQVLPANSSFIVAAMFISGIGHVTYSYISTNIILKVMNIVSHSIANIVKRLLVVLLLYSLGKRSAMTWNFFGLSITAIALWSSKSFHLGIVLCMCLISAMSLINASHYLHTNAIRIHGNNSYLNVDILKEYVDSAVTKQGTIYFAYNPAELNMGDNRSNTTELKYVSQEAFLTWRLVDHPGETDLRAKTLTTNIEIVEEAQRVFINILSDLIGPIQHVMLMEIATYSNKGDPAITAGEVMLLRKINKTIIYYCDTTACNKDKHMQLEKEISKYYTEDNLVILMQGGGNVVGYPGMDNVRKLIMDRYPKHRKILFSQSIWLDGKNNKSLINAQNIYNNRTNLTIFLRDRQSFEIAQKYFRSIRLILAPDLAFGLGALPRQMPPIYDIVWLQRKDAESSKYTLPHFPTNISVYISDWTSQWSSNVGSRTMETSFLVAFSGINFLQRGRVVVTDRLHGHILSTLLNIPHVPIDNPPYFKLSSFHNSWTYSLENIVIVDNGTIALETAMKLLNKFDTTLPKVGPVDMNRFPNV